MTSWLTNNWDKILGYVISIVIAGVVGFFSAIKAVDGQISSLQQRVVALETDSASLIKPKISSVDSISLEIDKMKSRMDMSDKENNIQKATYNLISLTRDEERRKTANEIKELLKEK